MDMMVAPAGRDQEEFSVFWEAGHIAGLVSVQMTEQRYMKCGTGELRAMEDDEKVDEDKREPGNGEDDDEEQEEEHQKARAIAGPDLPSRRDVEDHNLTHIPFRSRWHDGAGVDDRAVTTYSIEYMYFAEEGNAEERDAGEGTVRGSTTLDRKTGGAHAHQVKRKGSGDPRIATVISADIGKMGYGGSRVVLKADQESCNCRRTKRSGCRTIG